MGTGWVKFWTHWLHRDNRMDTHRVVWLAECVVLRSLHTKMAANRWCASASIAQVTGWRWICGLREWSSISSCVASHRSAARRGTRKSSLTSSSSAASSSWLLTGTISLMVRLWASQAGGVGDGELDPLLGSDYRACFQVRCVKRYPENLLWYPSHPHLLLSFISC